MSNKRYRAFRRGTNLYIAERQGSWARWSSKYEAVRETMAYWNDNLQENIRELLDFEAAD